MRALVVGYGAAGRRHADNLLACGVGDVLILRHAGRPAGAAAQLRFVAGLADGLGAKPDLAVIASPSAAHVDSLVPLLEAGVPCYVEKPPVTSAQDVERIGALLARRTKPTLTLTGCNLRFLPSLQRLREALLSGAIGAPVRASLQAGQWLPDWRPGRDYRASYSASAEKGGGVILDLVHEIDAARWLFGEFDQVRALGGKRSSLEIACEDVACVLLGRRAEGPVVSIGLDYVSRARMRRYEIVGETGTLTWDLSARCTTRTTADGVEVLDDDVAGFDISGTYAAAMREFLDAIREGRAASPDLEEGLRSTALALRAKRELAEGDAA